MNAPPPPPPPPPPPHGSHNQQQYQQHQQQPPPRNPNLPPGNYDIFVIPPHSSGSGFLYLPSLQVNRNSFLAGSVCTLAAIGIWILVEPVLKQWASTLFTNGGSGMILLVLGVGVLGWAAGKTQMENSSGRSRGAGPGGGQETGGGNNNNSSGSEHAYTSNTYGTHGAHAHTSPNGAHAGTSSNGTANGVPPFGATGSSPNPGPAGGPTPGAGTNPKPSWQRPNPSAGWEKAREEMRKKEEERKKREEAEKKAKEAAEKQKWEQSRQREREQREKEARERVAQERLKRERELKEQKEKQEREAREKERAAAAAIAKEKERQSQHSSNYKKPTAASFVSEETHSYRPYDKKPKTTTSQSSFVSGSETSSSWAGSQSTARTTPPPSHRGPYVNKDPDKVTLRAAFWFTDTLPGKPLASLVSGMGSVTDGLVLKMTTEGLFIDDDIRGVPQREWDIKAWTMKLVETGDLRGKHVLRASIRDAENKKYVFIIDESEAWKVAVGLQRLRKGSQVRSLGVSGMSVGEMTSLLKLVGY